MKIPLAGKRAFYAIGQRDRARGVNITPKYIAQFKKGHWARKAYENGWFGW